MDKGEPYAFEKAKSDPKMMKHGQNRTLNRPNKD